MLLFTGGVSEESSFEKLTKIPRNIYIDIDIDIDRYR